MSLINDALKRARQAPPVVTPMAQPPPPVVAPQNAVSVAGRLVPAVMIFLVMAAVFFIGWGVAHHSLAGPGAAKIAEAVQPVTAAAPSAPEPVMEQAASPAPALAPAPAKAPAPEPVNPPFAPKLQGIFYSPTDPAAILDGKTLHKGDHFKQYQVKDITASSVTLVDAGNKAIKVVMDN